MKVNEIFSSIQGEGNHTGLPVLFIRLSGCTRACKFCDTKYHTKGTNMSVKEVVRRINKSKMNTVVWTGGSPMLQFDEIFEVITKIEKRGKIIQHHLETNGDILPSHDIFQYIAFSPKDEKTAQSVTQHVKDLPSFRYDIKVVTNIETINKRLIKYATMLMPLTILPDDNLVASVYKTDKQRKQYANMLSSLNNIKVWNYCIEHRTRFCARVHVMVWGTKKRGV